MATKLFVNLPVKDLGRSKAFFTELGLDFFGQAEDMASVIISEHTQVMLLTEATFASYARNGVADATAHNETILVLGVETRQQVDELAGRAEAAGGQPVGAPRDDGYRYQRGFADLDGHHWEALCPGRAQLVRAGRRAGAVERFLLRAAQVSPQDVAVMRGQPFWPAMEAAAQGLAYEAYVMGPGNALPGDLLAGITQPALVLNGGASPAWMVRAGQAVADAIPGAVHRVLGGQAHSAAPEAIVPGLLEFLVPS